MSVYELFQTPWNFLGLPQDVSERARARGWLLPVPYEATTSYGAGARDGPAAILAASRQVELYDREFGSEPAMDYGVHTTLPLNLVHKSPEAMIQAVEDAVAGLLSDRQRPEVLGVLGGEHSISAGVVRGLARAQGADSLVAVHVDAHADLREEYEGSPYSHACAAKRIQEVCPIFQIGIRNYSSEEAVFMRRTRHIHTVFSEETTDAKGLFLRDLAKFVKNKRVYFTIDLDGLDPSIMPAVGTPEPGGISWERMLEIARTVCGNAAQVPVFDVVELAPIPGFRAPDFLAARLVYRLFSYTLVRSGKTTKKRRSRHG
ncbi:MAG: agmatinase [Acidobacteria bacterium]|nr:agmatinase [Acidobacteriota bacterium]